MNRLIFGCVEFMLFFPFIYVVQMEKHMIPGSISWQQIANECDFLYNYLINNYEYMLDGEYKIKHFHIEEAVYDTFDCDEFIEQYNDIEKELIPWIKKEHIENRLMNIDNWKPFRIVGLFNTGRLGYRKIFQYKQYYFQLSLFGGCEVDNCKYFEGKQVYHFALAIFGWKDPTTSKLLPDDFITIPDDCILQDSYWNEKI